MTELACKCTTKRLLHLSRSAVYTVDPANVEYMLKTNFANYGKGLYLHIILSDVLGDGIFAVDGAKWLHQRKALSSEFSSKMLRDFSSAVFKLGAVKLARVIATCDQAIDIQDLLMKSSLDSIVKILLGIKLACVEQMKKGTEKIAQEVREVINLKDHSSVDELAASLTDEDLKKMQYLHAALAETIRLYPAVPMDAKMCFSDDTWPDGFSIRKGDMVVYQPYAMGRMKFLWGDDAEEFRPERWLDKNGQFQDESPFKFTAFQAGPGQEHAYMEMKIFAAVLLGSYMFKLADENKVVNYKTMVSLQIDGGLYLHAFPRLRNESKTLNPML
ncbi:hypothetical protein ACLB2K_075839 [Fragaria x ananassa]